MAKRTWTKQQLIEAVKTSENYSEVCKALSLCSGGNNIKTIKKYIEKLNLSICHFLSKAEFARRKGIPKHKMPLEQILVEKSSYSRGHLKDRLYDEGFKKRKCELCGQGEVWQNKKMSLILDHINGVRNDNRLENLRIVCPNCNATLPTHCGKVRLDAEETKKKKAQANRLNRKNKRKVQRPTFEVLRKEISESNYSAVGRKYGVSDNAIRKWVRFYEKQESLQIVID